MTTGPKITKLRQQLLDDLASGATLTVTLKTEEKTVYEIHGGGRRYNKAFLDDFIPQALEAGLFTEVDPGLFPGCGQVFNVIRS